MLDKKFYLYVTPFFPSLTNWRGSYCFDFVRELSSSNSGTNHACDVNVLVFKPGDGKDYNVSGIAVHTFKTKQLPSNILPFLFRRYNERSFVNKVKEVLKSTVHLHLSPSPNSSTSDLDLFSRVSVCHAHTANFVIYPLAVKKLNSKCKTLLQHHDLQSFGLNLGVLRHNIIYNAWLFRKFRAFFEQIDVHVFISKKCRESFMKAPESSWSIFDDYRKQMLGPSLFHCRPVRIDNSIILHNGVDTKIFNPCSQPRLSTSTFTIGCIANFIDLKDQTTLIRAIGILAHSQKDVKFKCIFVGSGPTLLSCKELANSIVNLNLHSQPLFEFRTEVPHEKLAAFYQSIDLFVLPSYFEGFGCVLTEAWSCGVPFISCRGQGVDEMVPNNEKGLWLFEPRNADDLAAKIKQYLETRRPQHLIEPVSVTEIVTRFVKKLDL